MRQTWLWRGTVDIMEVDSESPPGRCPTMVCWMCSCSRAGVFCVMPPSGWEPLWGCMSGTPGPATCRRGVCPYVRMMRTALCGFHTDGELARRLPVEIEIKENALRVLVPE